MVLGKLVLYMLKAETRPPISHPIQKSTVNGSKVIRLETTMGKHWKIQA
jgi:hypothetical protein